MCCCPVDGDAQTVMDENNTTYYAMRYTEPKYTQGCPTVSQSCLACDDESRCCGGRFNDEPEYEYKLVYVN